MGLTFLKYIALTVLVLASSLANGYGREVSEQFTLQFELKHVIDNYTGKLDAGSEAIVQVTEPWTSKVTIYSDGYVIISSDRDFIYHGNATDSLIDATTTKVVSNYFIGNKIKINRYKGTFTLLALTVDTNNPTQLISNTRHGVCKIVKKLF